MPKPISVLILHRKRLAFLVAFIMILVRESKPGIDQLHPALWIQHSPVDNAEGNIPRGAFGAWACEPDLVLGFHE